MSDFCSILAPPCSMVSSQWVTLPVVVCSTLNASVPMRFPLTKMPNFPESTIFAFGAFSFANNDRDDAQTRRTRARREERNSTKPPKLSKPGWNYGTPASAGVQETNRVRLDPHSARKHRPRSHRQSLAANDRRLPPRTQPVRISAGVAPAGSERADDLPARGERRRLLYSGRQEFRNCRRDKPLPLSHRAAACGLLPA